MINPALKLPSDQLADFCRRHHVRQLALFGSATRDDFRPDSDVDLLVEFDEDAQAGLFDMIHMQDELVAIFGRPVDLLERKSVEQSRNYIRRQSILESVEPIYAAR